MSCGAEQIAAQRHATGRYVACNAMGKPFVALAATAMKSCCGIVSCRVYGGRVGSAKRVSIAIVNDGSSVIALALRLRTGCGVGQRQPRTVHVPLGVAMAQRGMRLWATEPKEGVAGSCTNVTARDKRSTEAISRGSDLRGLHTLQAPAATILKEDCGRRCRRGQHGRWRLRRRWHEWWSFWPHDPCRWRAWLRWWRWRRLWGRRRRNARR